ncbi:MAG: methionine--tRNA ligase [Gemmatimonadetes bacterium]|nr:MAG: methionine--tRNA ligase [Gemmatimonadota bacterium]
MSKFYLTTAIDYSNGEPHLGHALEKIGADCIARYHRFKGDDVHFVMGMDEHGQKVAQAAEKQDLPPQAWVDRIAASFEATWHRLDCSNDDWIRTTEPRHTASVTAFIGRIRERHPDDIFIGEYEGLYCVGCEEFKQPSQIVDGHCVEHPTLTLQRLKETNYFFRLSRYAQRLHGLITSGEFRVEPEIRRNEILRLLEDGLEDVSISRARFPWGIPFPGAPEHTVYVWFDALINYITAAGFPQPGYERLWPADLHVIGKGITRLHCALWPAMLLSANLALPRLVWAHGYVQWGGAKVSKSTGGALSVDEAIDRRGVDALRYFLLREVGFANDGDFTWERLDARYGGPCPGTPRDARPTDRSRKRRASARPRISARWMAIASRKARRNASSSPRAPTATSRRRRPGSSRRPVKTPSSIGFSPPWHAPWLGSRCSPGRSSRRPPARSGLCFRRPRPSTPFCWRTCPGWTSEGSASPSRPSCSRSRKHRPPKMPQKTVILITIECVDAF